MVNLINNKRLFYQSCFSFPLLQSYKGTVVYFFKIHVESGRLYQIECYDQCCVRVEC